MSMLGEQIKELREAARNIQGKLGRCLYRRKDVDEMQQISGMLFEAADTIEVLRKQVAKCQIAELKADYDTSRYFELFGTPERAARTICRQLKHFNICICDGCPVKPPNKECDSEYDALLDWLRGDA